MEFLVIKEHDLNENEVYIHYCQYTGNEVVLQRLIRYITNADNLRLVGDVSVFETSMVLVQEIVVDAHIAITEFNSYNYFFQKHTGVCIFPELTGDYALGLTELLHSSRMSAYFLDA